MGASFTSPWALVGLIALPLIWWLQKRLRRPPDVELPSLMFLLDEEEARALPRGRLLDAELLLALTAAALIAFAAAGPVLEQESPRTIVRVVLSGGAPATQRGFQQEVESALTAMRAAAGDDVSLDVRWVPDPNLLDTTPRPTPEHLLAEAQAGEASARFVLSDAPAPIDTASVTWIPLGRPDAGNTGIVAASVTRSEADTALFVTLANQGRAVAGRVVVGSDRGETGVAFRLADEDHTSVSIPLGAVDAGDLRVRLVGADGDDWTDDLAADDELRLENGPLRVRLDPAMPDALRASVRRGLTAVLGGGGFVPSDAAEIALDVGMRRAAPVRAALTRLRLDFQVAAEGEPVESAPAGATRVAEDPLVRDLAAAGGTWVFPAGATAVRPDERVLLARVADGRTWPVITRSERFVRLGPDPLKGTPRLVDTPFWPIFLENVVEAAGYETVGAGYRAAGLLDPDASRLGTRGETVEPGRLTALPPTLPGASRPLRGLLVLAALACLVLLWAAPRLRRLRTVGANPHGRAPARAV